MSYALQWFFVKMSKVTSKVQYQNNVTNKPMVIILCIAISLSRKKNSEMKAGSKDCQFEAGAQRAPRLPICLEGGKVGVNLILSWLPSISPKVAIETNRRGGSLALNFINFLRKVLPFKKSIYFAGYYCFNERSNLQPYTCETFILQSATNEMFSGKCWGHLYKRHQHHST